MLHTPKAVRFYSSLSLIILLALPFSEANGQYFGRNKVQYEDFQFQVLHTPHFDLYHYPKEAQAVRDLGKLSERWYARHSNMLNHSFKTGTPLIIYASHADFQQNDIIPSVGVGTGGVTEGLRNRVVMPFAEANKSTNHVLGHELVHAFQYDLARTTDKISGIRATAQMPLWFIEGMAEYLSVGAEDSHTAMWLRDALLHDDLPSIKDLSNSAEYFPYRYGHSLWNFIAGKWGDEVVAPLYVKGTQRGINKGFKEVLGISVDSVSTLWQNSIRNKYAGDVENRNNPTESGNLVLGKEKGTGSLNLAPSVSPDGKTVAFISEKNLFSLELFLADAQTGEIIRKLTSTDTDPHLNALRFIESAGTWSPDGERFAAVVFAKGDNQIVIIDTKSGKTHRTLHFKEVDAITNPAWSPGGDRIVFSGSDGGYTDLYLYNLKTDSLRNLTNDKYSDLQPAWSPDGTKLAFVTDRGPDTDFKKLTFGNMVINILNLQTGELQEVPEFYETKHINPQFSPDGKSLFYISDYKGFSNVFRYDFETGKRYQVTNVNTGVTGISQYSPAMTVARETGDMMISVFDESSYKVNRIPADSTSGRQILSTSRLAASDNLPPAGTGGNRIMRDYLDSPITDLPADTTFGLSNYKPTLRLTNITGGGGIGVSNQLGVGAAGGVNLQFSDMLNQHRLLASLRLQGTFRDLGGQLAYLNSDNRFIWGGSISHIPFRTSSGFINRTDTTTVDGQTVVAPSVNQIKQRIFQDKVSALGMYPLSSTQRFEFSAGWTHIWYDFELEKTFIDPATGQGFDRQNIGLDEPSPLNLVNASAAYVSDNSVSAFTGPIKGHRMRLEVEPTTGTLDFFRVTADYRRYWYFRPFTLAFRALHTGRYGGDSDSNRLSPEFVGFETLVRGYNVASFDPTECRDTQVEGCPEFNRLIGSRIGVANVEFRVPLMGAEQLSLFKTRAVPTTLTTFFDGGYAWNDNDRFSFDDLMFVTGQEAETNDRIPVFSTGVGLRFNLFGYIISEIYYAVPFQRPDQGGYIGFHIAPGW